jgi:hypothetical protein
MQCMAKFRNVIKLPHIGQTKTPISAVLDDYNRLNFLHSHGKHGDSPSTVSHIRAAAVNWWWVGGTAQPPAIWISRRNGCAIVSEHRPDRRQAR